MNIKPFFIFTFFIISLCSHAYDLNSVIVLDVDIWGTPILLEKESGAPVSKHPMRVLREIYSDPDFLKKKEEIFLNRNQESLAMLCMIWAYAVDGGDRVRLRNEIAARVLCIDLDKSLSAKSLAESAEFSKKRNFSPTLNSFLGLLLSDKVGAPLPALGGDERIYNTEMRIALMFRLLWLASCSGDGSDPLYKSLEERATELLKVRVARKESELSEKFLPFLQIMARTPVNFSKKTSRKSSSDSYSARTTSQARLLKALESKETNKFFYENEILELAENFFFPSYPFAEQILYERGHFEEAAFLHYLSWRHPYSLASFIELCPSENMVKNVLLLYAERYWNELQGAKLYEAARDYGIYLLALFSQSRKIEEFSSSLKNKIIRDSARYGKTIDSHEIFEARKRIGNLRGINADFERRYAKSLEAGCLQIEKRPFTNKAGT